MLINPTFLLIRNFLPIYVHQYVKDSIRQQRFLFVQQWFVNAPVRLMIEQIFFNIDLLIVPLIGKASWAIFPHGFMTIFLPLYRRSSYRVCVMNIP